MASHSSDSMAFMLLLGVLMAILSGGHSIGVCYGGLGDNLPQPSNTVALYKSNNIELMRIYVPDQTTQDALRGSGIKLLIGASNNDLQALASDANSATIWVTNNIKPYFPDVQIRYIAVGNEVIPGDLAQYVLPAMKNIYAALSSVSLADQIKVSTSVSYGVLGNTFPPSKGTFASDAQTYLQPIVQYLASIGSPILMNVYPYYTYIYNENDISLQYALFTSPGTVVTDGQYQYQNLFDALVDAIYSALETVGGAGVEIVVSESGWPSAGGEAATVANAQTYNSNLIKHVKQGTPKRGGKAIETYVFAMFDEDLKKPTGIENHWVSFILMNSLFIQSALLEIKAMEGCDL